MKRALTIFGSLLAASAFAQATTYVRVEKDGSKTYSDRPLPGGQPVEIQPAQTYSAPATPSNSSLSREQQQVLDAANFQYHCALSPRADETFQNPESVTLAVQLTPSLRPGDQVKFSLTGKGGQKFERHEFQGQLAGETITGTVRIGEASTQRQATWSAKRIKRGELIRAQDEPDGK